MVAVDDAFRIKGVISGRRILEVLLGRRGEALRAKKGIKGLLREPVNLFLDEARHVFPDYMTPQAILQYMAENVVGYLLVVNKDGVFKGVIDESSILHRLKGKVLGVRVKEVMSRDVYTVPQEATLLEASALMVDHRIRRLPVTVSGAITGILTVTDVLNHVLTQEKHVELLLHDVDVADILKAEVRDVMRPSVVSVGPQSDVSEAISKVIENDVSGLPVMAPDGKLLGIVSRLDLVARLIKVKGASPVLDMMVG